MSMPRSAKRSSTLRSDSGYLTYIIWRDKAEFRASIQSINARHSPSAAERLCL